MKVIAIANSKGGVSKTTSAINIGAGLLKLKKNVLLIDLDPQGHLTSSLGIKIHQINKTTYNLITGEANLKETVIDRNGLFVVPANIKLSKAEITLAGVPGGEYSLKEALEEAFDYDYVLLDCPPSLGMLTLNALTAADEVYIPLQTEFLALQGMHELLQTIQVVQRRLNPRLEITGIIATFYDKRKRLNNEVLEEIKEHFDGKVFETRIRDNVSLAEAPSYGQHIYEYRPKSYGAKDYLALSKEIIQRNQLV